MIGICVIGDCCAETVGDACGVRGCDGEVCGVGEDNTGGCVMVVGEAEASPWQVPATSKLIPSKELSAGNAEVNGRGLFWSSCSMACVLLYRWPSARCCIGLQHGRLDCCCLGAGSVGNVCIRWYHPNSHTGPIGGIVNPEVGADANFACVHL